MPRWAQATPRACVPTRVSTCRHVICRRSIHVSGPTFLFAPVLLILCRSVAAQRPCIQWRTYVLVLPVCAYAVHVWTARPYPVRFYLPRTLCRHQALVAIVTSLSPFPFIFQAGLPHVTQQSTDPTGAAARGPMRPSAQHAPDDERA